MASRRLPYWTCTRQEGGVQCLARNPNRFQNCQVCGKTKRKRSTKKHMAALNTSYEAYIELQGGEFCGICGRTRDQLKDPSRKLDRDHAHTTHGLGEPRGLLCRDCNLHVGPWYTLGRVEALAAYLRRHEQRMGRLTEEMMG